MSEISVAELRRGLDGLLRGDGLESGAIAAVALVVVLAVVQRATNDQHGVRVGWPVVVVGATLIVLRGAPWGAVGACVIGWAGARICLGLRAPVRPDVLALVASGVVTLGLVGTLPDLEHVLVLAGALSVVGLARSLRRPDRVGVAPAGFPDLGALVGLMVWLVVVQDGDRTRATVAGGLCVLLWALFLVTRRGPSIPLFMVSAGLSLAASRWVGFAADGAEVVLRTGAVVGVGVAAAALVTVLDRSD